MPPKIYIGSDKWGRKEWIGKLYPPDAKENELRKYYSSIFNFVEYRAALYKENSIDTVQPFLKELRKDDFKICPLTWHKFSPLLFHNPEEYINRIKKSMEPYIALNHLFGMTIFEVPAFSNKYEKAKLFAMIENCPHDYSLAVDLCKMEHLGVVNTPLLDHLNKHKVGIILSNKLVDYALNLLSPYIYYRIDVGTPWPSPEILLKRVPAHVKQVYICVTGAITNQERVAEVLQEFNEALKKT